MLRLACSTAQRIVSHRVHLVEQDPEVIVPVYRVAAWAVHVDGLSVRVVRD